MVVRGHFSMACRIGVPTYPMSVVLQGSLGLFTRMDKGFNLKFNVRPEYATITVEQLTTALTQGYGDKLKELVSVEKIDHETFTYNAHVILKERSDNDVEVND